MAMKSSRRRRLIAPQQNQMMCNNFNIFRPVEAVLEVVLDTLDTGQSIAMAAKCCHLPNGNIPHSPLWEGEHNEKAEKCENKSKIQMANEMGGRRRHCHGNWASQAELLFLSSPPGYCCKQKAISTCTIATLHVRCSCCFVATFCLKKCSKVA